MMEENNQNLKKRLEEIDMEESIKNDIEQTMNGLSDDSDFLDYFDVEQDNIAKINGQIDDAREEGEIKGRKERNIEIAKNLLNEHINLRTIIKTTGLSKEELEGLI